jgi:hypothetical protein
MNMSDQNVVQIGDRVTIDLPAYRQWYREQTHNEPIARPGQSYRVQSLYTPDTAIIEEEDYTPDGRPLGLIFEIPYSFLAKIG